MVDTIQSEKELTAEETALQDVRGSYEENYGFHDTEDFYDFKSEKGLTRDMVRQISAMKKEPEWMTEYRLQAYDIFISKPMPDWGADLSGIDFDNIYYYVRAAEKQEKSWDDVPDDIKSTFDKLGIPEAEQKISSGCRGTI